MFANIYSLFRQEKISIACDKKFEDLKAGDNVIYTSEEGQDMGQLLGELSEKAAFKEFEENKILRKASPEDEKVVQENSQAEKDAEKTFNDLVAKHKLEMKVVSIRYSFDNTRVEFMFVAPDRVDFRELVKDLARAFRKKIHLKQIGPRDRAKLVDGVGICGRQLCCSKFLPELKSVGMSVLRMQNLTHKSTDKLSGLCGKLRCCVNYEVELYSSLKKNMPEPGTKITYKNMPGVIIGVDVINERVRIKVKYDSEESVSMVPLSDVRISK